MLYVTNMKTRTYLTCKMIIHMGKCICNCGCQKEFLEISDQALALLVALSERKIPYDKSICSSCRLDKHKKRRLKTKAVAITN